MSKLIPVFYGVIRESKFQIRPDLKTKYFDWIESIKEGTEMELILRQRWKQRSNPQNKYYWAIVIKMISEQTGYEDEEVHMILRMMFLKTIKGKFETLSSTTELSTSEFEDYLEKSRRWAAKELNLSIPLPNEVDY